MHVHFTGYNKRYDEWLPFGTDRVRPEVKKHGADNAKCVLLFCLRAPEL